MAQSAKTVADKWQRNTSGSIQSYKDGINAVTQSPTEKAAAAVDRQVAGVQRAAAEGKTQRALLRVSLADWRKAAIDKGANRLASGVQAAVGKVESFLGEFLPYVEQGRDQLSSMPRGDVEQNIQRMVAMVRHNAAFRRSR